jgi:hypothetical protein
VQFLRARAFGDETAPQSGVDVALQARLREAVAQRAVAVGRRMQHAGGLVDPAHDKDLPAIGQSRDGARKLRRETLFHVTEGQGAQCFAIPVGRPFLNRGAGGGFRFGVQRGGGGPGHAQKHDKRKG